MKKQAEDIEEYLTPEIFLFVTVERYKISFIFYTIILLFQREYG